MARFLCVSFLVTCLVRNVESVRFELQQEEVAAALANLTGEAIAVPLSRKLWSKAPGWARGRPVPTPASSPTEEDEDEDEGGAGLEPLVEASKQSANGDAEAPTAASSSQACVDLWAEQCTKNLKENEDYCDDKPDEANKYCSESCGLCPGTKKKAKKCCQKKTEKFCEPDENKTMFDDTPFCCPEGADEPCEEEGECCKRKKTLCGFSQYTKKLGNVSYCCPNKDFTHPCGEESACCTQRFGMCVTSSPAKIKGLDYCCPKGATAPCVGKESGSENKSLMNVLDEKPGPRLGGGTVLVCGRPAAAIVFFVTLIAASSIS